MPRDPMRFWRRLPEAIAVGLLVWMTAAAFVIPDRVVAQWVPW